MQGLAVVTGASSGIGRACAEAFAQAGHPILALSRQPHPLEHADRGQVTLASVDVADYEAFADAVTSAERTFGPTDCLINAAGLADARRFDEVEPDSFAREVSTNLLGVLNGARAVIEGMSERRRGTIVNISSVSDRKTSAAAVAYTATKYGVRAASESLRESLATRGVRVINVAPGYVRTGIHEGMGISFDEYRRMLGDPDFMSAEELAGIVLYCYQLPAHVCVRDIVVTPTRTTF